MGLDNSKMYIEQDWIRQDTFSFIFLVSELALLHLTRLLMLPFACASFGPRVG